MPAESPVMSPPSEGPRGAHASHVRQSRLLPTGGAHILILSLLLSFAGVAHAQNGAYTSSSGGASTGLHGSGAPTGACIFGYTYTNDATGNFYSCNNSVWLLVGPGAAGSAAWSTLTPGILSTAGTFSASGNTWDFSAVTLFKLRVGAGASTSANGDLAYDSTAALWHIWQGAANRSLVASTNLGTSGQPCLSNADGSCTFADPIVSQATASNLNAQVVGNAASAAADSGNPVKMGCVFNTTQPTVTTGQRVDCQATARGAQIVGTGADTFHVTVDSAPTTAVTGTFWQATQPVSAASLPLPTGAATAAKQPALGTAGTPSADVITVQGVTSMTALKVDGSGVTQPVSGTVTVTQSTASNLKVDLSGTAANTTAIKVDGSAVTQPVSGTVTANLGTTPDPCGSGQAKSYAFYDAATNGATQLVALSSGKVIYVCSYSFSSSSATANTLKLVYGTGSNCATGQTAMTPGIILQAAASTGPIGKVNPNSAGLQTAASNALCVLTNAAQAAQAEVSYVQQ